jgi:hypothetical protein
MKITLDEIVEHQQRFRQEIADRECVVAALEVLRTHLANGRTSRSLDLGALASALLPTLLPEALPERAALRVPTLPALPAPPPPPPVKRYVHPELEKLGNRHGAHSNAVRWAIQRMTSDYTLRDLGGLLEREGYFMLPAEISVVMTRLKARGAVEEIKPGQGRTPAVFRKPLNARVVESESTPPDVAAPASTEFGEAFAN